MERAPREKMKKGAGRGGGKRGRRERIVRKMKEEKEIRGRERFGSKTKEEGSPATQSAQKFETPLRKIATLRGIASSLRAL